jgi:hypothetical protein
MQSDDQLLEKEKSFAAAIGKRKEILERMERCRKEVTEAEEKKSELEKEYGGAEDARKAEIEVELQACEKKMNDAKIELARKAIELGNNDKELQKPEMHATEAYSIETGQTIADFLKERYDRPKEDRILLWEDAKDFYKRAKESQVGKGFKKGGFFILGLLMLLLNEERMDSLVEKLTKRKIPGWAKSKPAGK